MLFLAREDGQGLVEYALLIAFVAIVIVVALGLFGQQLDTLFQEIIYCLPEPTLPECFGN